MLRCLTLVALVLWAWTQDRLLGKSVPTDDAAIYKAIIDHTIRPEVIRFDTGAGMTPTTVLVVSRTLASCPEERSRVPPMGCFGTFQIQFVATPLPDRTLKFDRLLTPTARAALAMCYRSATIRHNCCRRWRLPI